MLGYATPQHVVFGSPARFEVGRGYFGARNKNTTMQTQTTIAPTAPAAGSLLRRILAPAMIFVGLGLAAAWLALLGYGLVALIMLVI